MVIVPLTLAVPRAQRVQRARCKSGGRLDEIAYRSASRFGQAPLAPTESAKNDDQY
jgi:hypothetical protein